MKHTSSFIIKTDAWASISDYTYAHMFIITFLQTTCLQCSYKSTTKANSGNKCGQCIYLHVRILVHHASVFTKMSSLEMKLYRSYPYPGNPSPKTIVSVMGSVSTFFVTGLASSSLDCPSGLHCWNSWISTAWDGDDNCVVEGSA